MWGSVLLIFYRSVKSIKELINDADEKMYIAKQSGRNRVIYEK